MAYKTKCLGPRGQ